MSFAKQTLVTNSVRVNFIIYTIYMRILGINIPDEKRLEIALTVLYGIGRSRSQEILKKAGVDFGIRAKTLTPDQENKIRGIVEKYKIEGDLKRDSRQQHQTSQRHTSLTEAADTPKDFRLAVSAPRPTPER